MVSGTRCPAWSDQLKQWSGSRAAALKGSMTYAFTQGNSFLLPLLLLLLLRTHPPTSRPLSQPRGPYPSLKSQIPVWRPKSQPQGPNPILRSKFHFRGPNPSFERFGPQDRHLGLEAGIWASRLRYGPGGWGRGDGGGGGEEGNRSLKRHYGQRYPSPH